MKSKKYMLVVLSILMILFVFVSSAGAADANTTDVLSVDESANMVNNERMYYPLMNQSTLKIMKLIYYLRIIM